MKIRMLLFLLLTATTAATSRGQILISGYMANPTGTDSPYEYVQLVATGNIDFSLTPMAVIFANSTATTPATANGWVQGGSTTYELSLTSGTVSAGQVFYVGGSGKLIDGSGSTSLSGQTWIRALNTGTTGGDLFGSAASGGVVGNGGGQADGIAVFNTTTLTATTVPIDVLFYGSGVGSASYSSSQGYTLSVNDRYNGGVLLSSSYLFPDPSGNDFTRLTGTYDTGSSTWTTLRTGTLLSLTASSPVSAIDSQITVVPVPEPATWALMGLGTLALFGRQQHNRKS